MVYIAITEKKAAKTGYESEVKNFNVVPVSKVNTIPF